MSSLRPLVLGFAVIVVAIGALLVLGASDRGYRVRVQLDNANGLREGSPVEVGGVKRGEVEKLDTDSRDEVFAELRLDGGQVVGPDARILIRAKNLLGQKFIQLLQGDTRRAQRSGSTIPAARVEESIDLDRILNTLRPTTRARLALLINEAGAAVSGRRRDLNSLLHQLPSSFHEATRLVDEVVADNRTLGDLIERSDRFVRLYASERKELGDLVGSAGEAAATVAARRPELRRSLAAAPGTLRNLERFLAELEATTAPLGPAARSITASAPPLTSTLTAIGPFQRAASPTLGEVIKVAPRLTALGRRATPALRRTNPTVRSLGALAESSGPLMRTLDESTANILATLQGWARAIQGRDGISHMFRAKVAISTDSLRTLLVTAKKKDASRVPRKRPSRDQNPVRPSERPTAAPQAPRPTRRPVAPGEAPVLPDAIKKSADDVKNLLDYLLMP